MTCINCGGPVATVQHFLCPACRAGSDPDDSTPAPWDDDPLGRVCYRLWRDNQALFLRWFRCAPSRAHIEMACTYARARNQIERPLTPFHAAGALDMWYAALDAAESEVLVLSGS